MAVDYIKQPTNPTLIQSCVNAPDVSPSLHNFFLEKQIALPPFGMRNYRAAMLIERADSPFSINQLLNRGQILNGLKTRREELDRAQKAIFLISSIALSILLPWGLLGGLTFRVTITALATIGVVGTALKTLNQDLNVNDQHKRALESFEKTSERFTQTIIGNGIVHEMLINREKYLGLCSESKGVSKQHWQELNTLYNYLEEPAQLLLRQEAKTVYEQVMKERKERELLQTAS
ncbi:MAG: hypothetical protein Q8L98_06250 [Chlamydiales bacterium]|nr:hypothetical protein [Chlamydiales bacterium]